MRSIWIWSAEFLSTLSLRRATFFANVKNVWDHVFLSTLSLRRATTMRPWMQAAMTYFYPRSPCGERPSARLLVASLSRQFLSTLSLRRATAGQFCPGRTFQISIHALLAESDRHCADTLWFRRHISIHALLAESDQAVPAATPRAGHFYPRSPCGERRHWQTGQSRTRQFLSTLSLRRATVGDTPPCCGCMISIHALLAESDLTFTFTLILLSVISIHALLAESDFKANVHRAKSRLFLSTLSLRRATILCVLPVVQHTDFYPRSPCGERP